MQRYRRRRRFFKVIAPFTLFCFVVTFVATPYCRAAASSQIPSEQVSVRTLTEDEMDSIRGAQFSGGGDPSISYDSGEPFVWEGQIDTTNTSVGNKMTSIPLFGWTVKGGMPVAFTLYHSSKSNRSGDVGQRFSHSYTIYLHINTSNGKRTIHWGDDTAYDFTPNGMGGFTAPPGIHDTLVTITGGYKLTTKNQTSYIFDINTQGQKFYCTKIDDRNGNRITLGYTGGFPGPYILSTITDPTSRAISLTYTNGKITSVTSPQSRSCETPNGRVTELTCNVMGVTTSRKDALLRTTSYTLDEWNRTTATDYPTGTDPSFTYDPESNLTQWVDSTGTWQRTYDDAGRILTEKLGGVTQVSYTWDATGKKGLLSSITDESGRTITYNYTDRQQLASVADSAGTASYVYDSDGRETGVTLQNGAVTEREFDDAGRLTVVRHKTSGGSTLNSFTYGYSDDNVRTSCTEANGDIVSYGYDGAYRLTSESRTGANSYVRSYTLDGVGNRTSQTVGGVTTSFTLNADYELTATSGGFSNSYSYNANGEQTGRTLSGAARTLAYDFEGQLTSITQGSNVTSFTYDAMGRRITRTSGGTTTRFIGGPGGILLEKQGSSYTRTYTPGVRMNSEYPLFDGAGSERTVTAANQSVSGTITFEGFGQTVATTGSSSNPYMYKGGFGYRNDGDAALHHVGARYYDAQVGRFITRDTYLDQHPYLYCEHDPVNRAGPSGHFVMVAPWIIGAGAAAFTAYRIWRAAQAVIGLGALLMAGGMVAESIRHNHRQGNPAFRPGPGGRRGDSPRTIPEIPRPIEPPWGGLPKQGPPLIPDGTPGDKPYTPPINPWGETDPTDTGGGAF